MKILEVGGKVILITMTKQTAPSQLAFLKVDKNVRNLILVQSCISNLSHHGRLALPEKSSVDLKLNSVLSVSMKANPSRLARSR